MIMKIKSYKCTEKIGEFLPTKVVNEGGAGSAGGFDRLDNWIDLTIWSKRKTDNNYGR